MQVFFYSTKDENRVLKLCNKDFNFKNDYYNIDLLIHKELLFLCRPIEFYKLVILTYCDILRNISWKVVLKQIIFFELQALELCQIVEIENFVRMHFDFFLFLKIVLWNCSCMYLGLVSTLLFFCLNYSIMNWSYKLNLLYFIYFCYWFIGIVFKKIGYTVKTSLNKQ